MLIKTTLKYCYTPIRMVKLKMNEILRVGKDVEQLNLFFMDSENLKNGLQFLINSNILTIRQINFLLVSLPKRDKNIVT